MWYVLIFHRTNVLFFRVDRSRQKLQNDAISYSEKNEGGLQNPLSNNKGSELYPVAELLKNNSAQEKIVLEKKKWFWAKKWFWPKPFFMVQNHFSGVLPSDTTQNPFYQKVGSEKPLHFFQSRGKYDALKTFQRPHYLKFMESLYMIRLYLCDTEET